VPQYSTASDEYEEWLDRVRSTYEAVSFTCVHRLGDRHLADQVSAQVVAGMISKPGVVRFFGLPYSARIGHLAEDRIAAARAGQSYPTIDWSDLLRNLREIPQQQRRVFVLSCVRGSGPQEIAEELGVSVSAARELRDDVLRRMRSIAGKEADDDETSSSGSGR
jgi:DNA-directed RNA polymerase specialized sigma24 family protein